jgi:uncharacterized PurR-regulated membrane protein YhhQ (DUF165 family)
LNFLLQNKKYLLFLILAGFFLTNTIVAELVGIKIFSLEKTLGFSPLNVEVFNTKGLGLNLTAGVLLWPIVFVMTDVINEYFGPKVVKYLSYFTIVLVFYAFMMIYGTINLAPNDWWTNESGMVDGDPSNSISNMNLAFGKVMGQGMKIIIASMIAFLIGQVLDAVIFQKIKKITGDKKVWLRATGSTLISQWIDSYVVLIIAFYFFSDWDLSRVLAIGTVNYCYKFIIAILLTPIIYLTHYIIDNWLGKKLAKELKHNALQ